MKKLSLIFLVICWGFLILIFFIYPMPETDFAYTGETSITFYDKLIHVILFGVFTYLIILVGFTFKKNYFVISLTSYVISFNYMTLGEYIQAYIPGRNPTYPDLAAGLFGTLIAIVLGYLMHCSPKQKLLLHTCCGGCAAYVIKILRKNFKVYLYYYNPNIYPKSEYDRRLKDIKKISRKYFIKLFIGTYNHSRWKKLIKGHENDHEGGKRCKICYRLRLEETAKFAKKNNFHIFGTTLTISPHKESEVINTMGEEIAQSHNLVFLENDFKDNGGFKKSVELSKKLKLYRQDYCGCEYSIKK